MGASFQVVTSYVGRPRDPTQFLVLPLAETPYELRRSPGVAGIVVLSLAVVALGGVWPPVTRSLEATTAGLADWELWRVATYVFPHEHGWLHVAVNMTVLSLFGWQLERRIGTGRFLLVYLGSGAVGMALLFGFNPIDAERGIRSGGSLAVFGVVAALATWHALREGWRSPAMLWAIPTCAVLLTAAGIRQLRGKEGLIEPGFHGFAFGFLNHALGMIAGVLLALALVRQSSRSTKVLGAAAALLALIAGLQIGAGRWA